MHDGFPLFTRRTFLGTAAGSALAAALAARAHAASSGVRPNIVLLVARGVGADRLEAAHTPALDRLAGEGVRWSHCFSAGPGAGRELPFLGDGRSRLLRRSGYYCTSTAAGADPTAWDDASPTAHWRDRRPGVPFFAVVESTAADESTLSVLAPPREALPGTASPPPPALVGGPATAAAVHVPPFLPDTPAMRADIAVHLNRVHLVDREFGTVLGELDEAGLADDTIVVVTADHPGALPRAEHSCHDGGLRVPLLARFGRRAAHLAPTGPGQVLDEPRCATTALAPTLLALAGVPAATRTGDAAFAGPGRSVTRYAFAGSDRVDERYGLVRSARDERYRYIRSYLPHAPHLQRHLRRAGHRDWAALHQRGALSGPADRHWRERPAEELYDLRGDPHEIRNLAADPTHTGVLHRLRAALDEHLLATGDRGFLPAESDEPYPLRDVLALTALAARRDPATLPDLIRHLGSPHPVLRFWAATACRALDAGPALPALRAAFSAEPDPHTRVALADALTRATGDRTALRFLAETVTTHPDPWVRLRAANALDDLGPRARPALPDLVAAASAPADTEAQRRVRACATHTVLTLGIARDQRTMS